MPWVLFVKCCDRNFQKSAQNLRRHLGITKGHYDPISVPGGAGNLSVMKHSLELLCPIRPTERLAVLTIHEGCAAKVTEKDLMLGVEVAKQFFPEVQAYILRKDESFTLVHHWQQQQPVGSGV